MFVRNIFRKFFHFKHVKIIITVLLCTIVINFYLFYNLKFISHHQKTDQINESKTSTELKNKPLQVANAPSKRACKVGNYSTFIKDLIYQIKEDLEDFYSNSSNSTIIQLRCSRFLSNTPPLDRLILTNHEIDFANRGLVVSLKTNKVLKVHNAPKGTQLKLLVNLSNNLTGIFKPRWYSPKEIITGQVYSGKDRHYGEVIAFYLSILLDLRRVPPAVIRKLHLREEIISVSDRKLLDTFLSKGNETCFYGVCYYCSPSDLLCTSTNQLEGSLIYYLSSMFTLQVAQHPWRRTYRCTTLAQWEIDENYCAIVRNSKFYYNQRNKALFLDLMETAIADFLIDNGDRHHYEYALNSKEPRLLLVDNGKSFGNPNIDHIDILAPVYQCCSLRNSTWTSLLNLRGGDLSKWLKFLINESDSDIEINELHYEALDRRLLVIFATMEYCFKKFGIENVLVVE